MRVLLCVVIALLGYLYSSATPAANVSGQSASPDPFAASATISYTLGSAALTWIKIYNSSAVLKRKLLTPASFTATNKAAGANSSAWDGKDDSAVQLPDGDYSYHIDNAFYSADYSNFGGGSNPQDITVDPANTNNLWMTNKTSPYVYKSTNGGTSFTGVNTGLADAKVYGIVTSSDGQTIYIANDGQTLIRSTDGGANWGSTAALPGAAVSVSDVATSSTGQVVYVLNYSSGAVYRSANGGTSWSTCAATGLAPNTGAPGPSGIATDSAGTTVLVADSVGNKIWKSTNSCSTFSQMAAIGSGTAAGQVSFPYQIAIQSDGKFWASERDNHRIQQFDTDGTSLMVYGGTASGAGNYQLNSGSKYFGIGLATIGGQPYVFVADYNNSRIKKIGYDNWASAANLTYDSTTVRVCASGCDFTGIQAAIDDAATVNGDTVLVSDGTYSENIDFRSKNITVRSVNGAALTTIRGSGANSPVVTFNSASLTNSAVLDGFTIDNQAAANTLTRGIYIAANAAPTIQNCTINSNLINTTTDGAGIYITGATATTAKLSSSTVSNNSGRSGVGIYITGGADLEITNTIIDNNDSNTTGDGGGIYVTTAGSSLTMTGGSIINNAARYGAGVYVSGVSATLTGVTVNGNASTNGALYATGAGAALSVTRSAVRGNTASTSGGGVYAIGGTTTITNSDITGNTAATDGGGALVTGSTTLNIYNSTVAGNYAGSGSNGGGGVRNNNGTLNITNGIVYGNTSASNAGISTIGTTNINYSSYQAISGTCTSCANNRAIGENPLLVNLQQAGAGTPTTAGDFHLSASSPVIGQGTNNGYTPDIDGDARSAPYDMGSDEYVAGGNNAPVGGYTADNVIPAAQISQATNGTGVITITWKGRDSETNNVTLKTFEYSVDGGTGWAAPTNGDASAALSASWTNNGGGGYTTAATLAAATAHSFTLNTQHADVTGLSGVDQSDVRVRFKLNDGTIDSAFVTSENVRVDNLAATATITSASYVPASDTLTITGTNFTTIAATTTDIKSYVDWTKFAWDINGDNATTANITALIGDVTSFTVTDDTTLTLIFTAAKGSAIESTSGYGPPGSADTLDVSTGFLKDAFGNVPTTDAVADGALTIPWPSITVTKLSTVISDPINNTTNPKRIPGAVIEYSIAPSNSGDGSPDANATFVVDVIDTNGVEFDATTGVSFTDGATSSTLALGTVTYSNDAAPGPYAYTYTPTAGYDPAVTSIKVTTTGTFANGGNPAPGFTVKYRVRVK